MEADGGTGYSHTFALWFVPPTSRFPVGNWIWQLFKDTLFTAGMITMCECSKN